MAPPSIRYDYRPFRRSAERFQRKRYPGVPVDTPDRRGMDSHPRLRHATGGCPAQVVSMLVCVRIRRVRSRRWSGGVRCLGSRRRCACRGALIASSPGSCPASMSSRSITTEVSMRRCDARAASVRRCDLLAGGLIEVRSQPVQLDTRSASERRHSRLGTDESMATQWRQLFDRNPIPGHNEGFALVKLAHNLAAVIAELTLGDLSGHIRSVGPVLHHHARCSGRGGRYRSGTLS